MPKDDNARLSCLREQQLAKRARMDLETRKKGGAVSGGVAFQALGNGDALLLYTNQVRVPQPDRTGLCHHHPWEAQQVAGGEVPETAQGPPAG